MKYVYKVSYTYSDKTKGELVDRFKLKKDAQKALKETKKVWTLGAPVSWSVDKIALDKEYFEKWDTTYKPIK